jgi:hypothetical protein
VSQTKKETLGEEKTFCQKKKRKPKTTLEVFFPFISCLAKRGEMALLVNNKQSILIAQSSQPRKMKALSFKG